ncbi:MAG TPA: glycoside hydrolase family 43 protein [Chitinophagaceae bacterium]|nr:glycoside hydrolase family 43 protein [Chitinophagaceae bacterium]
MKTFRTYFLQRAGKQPVGWLLLTGVLLLFFCGPLLGQQEPVSRPAKRTYTNPLDVAMGDPFVLYASDGRYYLYGTGGGAKDGFAVYSSEDLVDWKYEGQVYKGNTADSWCTGDFWAPEVYERNGRYYMFYSAQWRKNPHKEKENYRIGVAVADKPAGPFTDIVNRPVFDPGYPIIDADVFFDVDGRAYLYYSRCCYKHPVESELAKWARRKGWYDSIEESWVYGVALKPDFSGVTGKPVLLLRPPVKMSDSGSAWESRSVTAHEVNRRWTEGSFTFKHGSTYYIMYSANYFGGAYYAVGYATGKSPLGPFRKSLRNPVLQKNTGRGGVVSGTGHNSVVFSPDGKEMFCVYHARTNATGNARRVFMDRMEILKDGTLIVHGPDTNPQPLPSGLEQGKRTASPKARSSF